MWQLTLLTDDFNGISSDIVLISSVFLYYEFVYGLTRKAINSALTFIKVSLIFFII